MSVILVWIPSLLETSSGQDPHGQHGLFHIDRWPEIPPTSVHIEPYLTNQRVERKSVLKGPQVYE